MVHHDTQASPCVGCGSKRAQYTMPNRGAGVAKMRCQACNRLVSLDTAADVARKVSPTLEATRTWWQKVYG